MNKIMKLYQDECLLFSFMHTENGWWSECLLIVIFFCIIPVNLIQ